MRLPVWATLCGVGNDWLRSGEVSISVGPAERSGLLFLCAVPGPSRASVVNPLSLLFTSKKLSIVLDLHTFEAHDAFRFRNINAKRPVPIPSEVSLEVSFKV